MLTVSPVGLTGLMAYSMPKISSHINVINFVTRHVGLIGRNWTDIVPGL